MDTKKCPFFVERNFDLSNRQIWQIFFFEYNCSNENVYFVEFIMINNASNQTNSIQDQVKSLSEQELKDKLKLAQESSNLDDMLLYGTEMKRRMTPEVSEFEKQQKEMEEKIKSWKMKKKEMKAYFLNNMKTFKSKVHTRLDETDTYKDKKIAELQQQLSGVITDLPGLGEYFSLERRRLVNITKKIQAYKADTANYPKNFLIYCMAITNTKAFGVREWVKRGRIKMLWKRKNDDIKGQLNILDKKLEPINGESKNRQLLKDMLRKEVQEAKNKYIEEVKKSVGV